MLRVLTFYFAFLVFQTKANHRTFDLQKAMAMKLIEIKAEGIGGYQGFCVNMHIKNISPDSLYVVVEAGRRLNSIDDKYQDILIVREDIVQLKAHEIKNVKVKGYCCQASNSAPLAGTKYSVNKMADAKLLLLARYLNSENFDMQAEQQAIWAISDNHQTAKITSFNDSLLLPLRQFVATIKDEPLPWYILTSSTHVYSNGIISVTPLLLKGKIEYNSDKDNYVTLSVKNEKGAPVCLIKTEWLKACIKGNYNLNLPVKGLAKGKYFIELKTSEKQLTQKEFEI